jgi:hypothetical protein
VEAIGILEEILRFKKQHFGINSKEVSVTQAITYSQIVHEVMQTAL